MPRPRALVQVLVRRAARLDVEHAFFEGGDADPHVVRGDLGGVEACSLALGMAVESHQEVGFDSPSEFPRAVLGGLDFCADFRADDGGDGLDGVVQRVAELLMCDGLVGSFGFHGRAAAPFSIMPLGVGASIFSSKDEPEPR